MLKKPSIISLYALALLPILLYHGLQMHSDTDMYWHLAAGKWMLQFQRIPFADPFALNDPRIWIDHEWLSQLIFAAAYSLGYKMLNLLMLFICVLTFFSLYKLLQKRGLTGWANITVIFFVGIQMLGFLVIRPQLFTYLFSVILVYLLESEHFDIKYWIAVPLLMISWANLHGGGSLFALLLMGGYLVSSIISKQYQLSVRFFVMFILSVLSLGINPYGFQMPIMAIKVSFHSDFQRFIQEWGSPNFHYNLPFLMFVIILLSLIIWSSRRLSFKNAAFILGLFLMSLLSTRQIALFVLLSPFFVTDQIKDGLNTLKDRITSLPTILRLFQVVCLVGALFLVPYQISKWSSDIPPENNAPMGAYHYLKEHPIQGQIYVPYNWGGSLLFYFPGQLQPSIDGRADMYSGIYNNSDYFHEVMTLLYLKFDPDTYFSKYPVSLVLVENNSSLSSWFSYKKDWSKVYSDSTAVIFQQKGSE